MKYYYNGKLLFVDMVHNYQFAVVEGDRVISTQQTRRGAEIMAEAQRQSRREFIRRLQGALDLDEVTRMQESDGRLFRSIREDYPTPSAIHAAIQRQKRTLASIRVEPLEVRE